MADMGHGLKPFVKRQKNDTDAKAICEAAQRPAMRFVAVKSEAKQAAGERSTPAELESRASGGCGERFREAAVTCRQ